APPAPLEFLLGVAPLPWVLDRLRPEPQVRRAWVESELGERLAGEHGKPGCAPVVVVGGLRGHAFEQSMGDDDRAGGQLGVSGDPAPDVLAVVDEVTPVAR